MSKRCPYCLIDNPSSYHNCPFEKSNLRKILLFMKENLETKSKFNKNFNPFPSTIDFDNFLMENKITRLQTIRVRYLEDGLSLEEWLSELIDYALREKIVTEDEFAPWLLYIYDAWCYMPREQYQRAYEAAIEYEDGDDIFGTVRPLPDGAIPFTLNLDTESQPVVQ